MTTIKNISPVDLLGVKDRTTNFINFMQATAFEIVPGNTLYAYISNTKMFEKVKVVAFVADIGIKVSLIDREKNKFDNLIVASRDLFVKLD
jgi:hypothetical protein